MSQVQGASSANYAAQWQYLQSFQQSSTDPMVQPSASDPMSSGFDPFSVGSTQPASGSSSGPPFSLGAMSALMAAQEQSGATGLSPHQQDVFGKLDADGDGKVTSAELQNAFGSDNTNIANYVMGKLDTDGDGAISQSEFGAGTTRGMGHHHHHMHATPPDGSQGGEAAKGAQGAQDPLSALLSSSANGASAQTTDNSDGSTTTTVTYADGSKVSMTSAANASTSQGSDASGSASPTQQTQQNLLQQLIKLQAQLTQNFQTSMPVATI